MRLTPSAGSAYYAAGSQLLSVTPSPASSSLQGHSTAPPPSPHRGLRKIASAESLADLAKMGATSGFQYAMPSQTQPGALLPLPADRQAFVLQPQQQQQRHRHVAEMKTMFKNFSHRLQGAASGRIDQPAAGSRITGSTLLTPSRNSPSSTLGDTTSQIPVRGRSSDGARLSLTLARSSSDDTGGMILPSPSSYAFQDKSSRRAQHRISFTSPTIGTSATSAQQQKKEVLRSPTLPPSAKSEGDTSNGHKPTQLSSTAFQNQIIQHVYPDDDEPIWLQRESHVPRSRAATSADSTRPSVPEQPLIDTVLRTAALGMPSELSLHSVREGSFGEPRKMDIVHSDLEEDLQEESEEEEDDDGQSHSEASELMSNVSLTDIAVQQAVEAGSSLRTLPDGSHSSLDHRGSVMATASRRSQKASLVSLSRSAQAHSGTTSAMRLARKDSKTPDPTQPVFEHYLSETSLSHSNSRHTSESSTSPSPDSDWPVWTR